MPDHARTYGNDTGTPMEEVLQQILNDAPGGPVPLRVAKDPQTMLTAWQVPNPPRSVEEAATLCANVAGLIGWEVVPGANGYVLRPFRGEDA